MKIEFRMAVALVVMVLPTTLLSATWTPIAGIPQPPFGITQEPPALPSPWNAEVAGFYYVCPSCSGSRNTSFGTPSAPKSDFPNTISNGDVVVLGGNIGGENLNFACSSAAPCFLLGDPARPPTMSGETTFGGSYYIVDGVHVTLPSNASGSTLGMTGNHGAFRNGRVTGNTGFGGVGTEGNNHVIFNSKITDNGNVNATNDQDRHGIKVHGNYIWIIGNEFTRNSGDGVQVGDIGTRASVHHIYIGNNVAYNNKQTGFWVKEAEHVIISQNLAYNHKPSGSSSGEGFGGQYDPRYVWFLFNESRNNEGGIGFKSANNGGGSNFYLVGNYIHDNISSEYNPNDGWSVSAVSSWNSADISIVNNTIDRNTGGVNLNGNTGSVYIYNNAITNMLRSNAPPILAPDTRDIQYQGSNALTGQEQIDAGMTPLAAKNPYAIFQSQYGMNISVDFDGGNRPVGQWDIGAFESQSGAAPRPKAPSQLIGN